MRGRTFFLAVGMALANVVGAQEHGDDGLAFINANDLHAAMQTNQDLFVFDVRTLDEYLRGHIEGARSLPLIEIEKPQLARIDGLYRDSDIVTYCGCPHHLSGLAARKLEQFGYTSVRVLEEGFWFWLENEYPVLPAVSEVEVTQISVSGQVLAGTEPAANVDLFLEHADSGQLEATRTDANGRYTMHMRMHEYQPADRFRFYVADLESEPVREYQPASLVETGVVITY